MASNSGNDAPNPGSLTSTTYAFYGGDYKQKAISGTPLAEVLSIRINPVTKEYKLYGKILVEDDEGTVGCIFNFERDDPLLISSDSLDLSLELCQCKRAILGRSHFNVYFNIREGDAEFLYGSFSWDAETAEDYDKPLVETIRGRLGSATMNYIVHSLALEAHIGASLIKTEAVTSKLNVEGTIFACFKNRHDCDARGGLTKNCQVKILDVSSFEMGNGDIFPFNRTVVAMPLNLSLVIQVDLHKHGEGEGEDRQVLWKEEVMFSSTEVTHRVDKDIKGVHGSIRVSVYAVNYAYRSYAYVKENKERIRNYGVIPLRYWAIDSDDDSDDDIDKCECKTIVETEGQNADAESIINSNVINLNVINYNYRELATATKNFQTHHDIFLGNGRFGSVFRVEQSVDKVLAVKKLNPLDLHSEEEFVAEVQSLSQLSHPNLVNVIGYCAEGSEHVLVFKYMPLGSLERHLHDLPADKQPLDWSTRINIALGIARGIDYLHQAMPSIIIGHLKPSNILLDERFNPKLSDFGPAKLCRAPNLSTKDMGTNIYRAREFFIPGRKVTSKCDTYSFGVILLEIISGRKAYDDSRELGKTSIVKWFDSIPRPEMPWERKSYLEFADPKLNGEIPEMDLWKVLALASMCLRENSSARPTMKVVASALGTVLELEAGHNEARGGNSKRKRRNSIVEDVSMIDS